MKVTVVYSVIVYSVMMPCNPGPPYVKKTSRYILCGLSVKLINPHGNCMEDWMVCGDAIRSVQLYKSNLRSPLHNVISPL